MKWVKCYVQPRFSAVVSNCRILLIIHCIPLLYDLLSRVAATAMTTNIPPINTTTEWYYLHQTLTPYFSRFFIQSKSPSRMCYYLRYHPHTWNLIYVGEIFQWSLFCHRCHLFVSPFVIKDLRWTDILMHHQGGEKRRDTDIDTHTAPHTHAQRYLHLQVEIKFRKLTFAH